MKTFRRMLIAGFLAPLTVFPAVVFAVVAVSLVDLIQFDFLDPQREYFIEELVELGAGLALIGIPVGWCLMLVFGIPVFLILRTLDLHQVVPCVLVGATFGLLFGTGFGNGAEPVFLVVMTTCGAVVAGTFSGIANAGSNVDQTQLYVDESVS